MRITDNGEKHGELIGGLATEEALNSSATLLQRGRGGNDATKTLKGAQQWWTPEPIADFVARVVGTNLPVIDTTAGTGRMIQSFDEGKRFGIELDRDHVKASGKDYEAIQGDATRVVPLMRALGMSFPAVCINPPFGLQWNDPVHVAGSNPDAGTSSTVLAYLWAQDLLRNSGNGAMLCGTNKLKREVLRRPEAQGIYAIVDLEGEIWKGVTVDTSLAFFINKNNLPPENHLPPKGDEVVERITLSAHIDDLDSTARALADQRARYAYMPVRRHCSWEDTNELNEQFKAVGQEHTRRKKSQSAASKKKENKDGCDMSLKGKKISVHPNAYSRIRLAKSGHLRQIELLKGTHVNYFAQNGKDWTEALKAEEQGLLTIGDTLKQKVTKVIEDAKVTSTPLFPVRPQMRLGWLEDLSNIKCLKDDEERGFTAGTLYPVSTYSAVEMKEDYKVVEDRYGVPERRKVVYQRKLLKINIKNNEKKNKQLTEDQDDIEYLVEHFDMPDPGCVATRFPDEYARMISIIEGVEVEVKEHYARYQEAQGINRDVAAPFSFKSFQKDHMARLLMKSRGLLAHEQGLGKTLMLIALTEATRRAFPDCEDKGLFIAPQDLLPQWQREAKKFFGRELTEIRTPEDAIRARTHLNAGGTGWYITYYECLSVVGKNFTPLPTVLLDRQRDLKERLKVYKHLRAQKKAEGINWNIGAIRAPVPEEKKKPGTLAPRKASAYDSYYYGEPEPEPVEEVATSRWACPKCKTDTANGWTGEVCRRHPDKGYEGCGYVHRSVRKKPSYAYLTGVFDNGVVAVDEISEIRGDDSLRSKAIRALGRGRHHFGATGTPLSNYINDSFWGLWFTLGNASAAFPYDYSGGKQKFEQDFAVIEHMMGKAEKGEEHKRQRSKVLPQVTNISQFWRLTQPHVSRCRKEQTGEPLVERIFHPVEVPLGIAQKKFQNFWIKNFVSYFSWKHPEHEMVKSGIVERFQEALGLGWRLESAATMPGSDASFQEWPQAQWPTAPPGEYDWTAELSNWTPANLKVLEIALEHINRGEKVLIGSDLIATGKWLSDQLVAKGVKSIHLTEEKQGKTSTKNPRKRASEVKAFVNGDAQVMCAGVNAMKLGHNLDVASTVIVQGLPYSHMVMDQFIARVHRLTSKKPVNVYVVLPQGTLATKKWDLLKDKEGASDLAFDGQLATRTQKVKDLSAIVREMREQGIAPSEDNDMPEADVYEAYKQLRYTPQRQQATPRFRIEKKEITRDVLAGLPVEAPPIEAPPVEAPKAGTVDELIKRKEKKKTKKIPRKATQTTPLFDFDGEDIVYEQVALF